MTGGWPLAVQLAAEVLRRVGPIDHSALVDRLLAPDAVLFEYLAEEVLAGAAEGERELLSIAARLPHVSPAVLGEIGRARPRRPPRAARRHRDLPRQGHVDARPLPAERARRRVRPRVSSRRRPRRVLRAAVAAFVRLGEIESALVLCAEVGDPGWRSRSCSTSSDRDRLRTPEALAGVLRLAG